VSTKPGQLQETYGGEGDYDDAQVSPEQIAGALRARGVAGVVYTSPSHQDKAPRSRILLPFSTPMKSDQRAQMISRLAGIIPGPLAPESWTASQPYYYGRVGLAPQHRVLLVEGDFIDQRPDLDATAKPKHTTNKRRRKPAKGNGADAADLGELLDADLPLDPAEAYKAIAEGEGSHEGMVRLAGRLTSFGLPHYDIAEALRNALNRRPPQRRDAGWYKAFADTDRLVEWVVEREADKAPPSPPSAPSPPPSSPPDGASTPASESSDEDGLDLGDARGPIYADDTLALYFAELHVDRLRYVAAWSQWLWWNDSVLREDESVSVEISRVTALLSAAEEVAHPHIVAFQEADEGLPTLHRAREYGLYVSKAQMLAAYDARLAAGHAAYPYQRKIEELECWLAELQRGLARLRRAAEGRRRRSAESAAGDSVRSRRGPSRMAPNPVRDYATDAALRPQPRRDGPDNWPTPPCLAGALVHHVLPLLPPGPIWECAVGDGALVRAMRAAGHTVAATDISNGQDFLRSRPPPGCRVLVTNAPFYQLDQFLRRSLTMVRTPCIEIEAAVLLLRLDALAARVRASLLERAFAIHVCAWRPRWIAGSTTSPRWSFCWVTWLHSYAGPPKTRWVRQSRQLQLLHAVRHRYRR
jgi:hypothetical protein